MTEAGRSARHERRSIEQASPLLRVEVLSLSFSTDAGRVRVVEDVSFEVHRGRTVGLVGESGCGKSVTAMTLLRLLPSPPSHIDGGRILFDGEDLSRLGEHQLRSVRGNRIGMVFQEPMTSLNPTLSVGFQIAEVLRLHRGQTGGTARKAAIEMLHQVGVGAPERRIEQYPYQLSGGLRQRVMIAMALVCHPSPLIADEPVSALDVSIQSQILELLIDLKDRLALSYIFISHDLAVVEHVSDRVAVMYLGQIVETTETERLYREPRHPYTEALISAVPQPDPEHRQSRIVLSGDIPNPEDPPGGCRFHPRCPKIMDGCSAEEPDLVNVGPQHRPHLVSCHLYRQGVVQG